MKFVSVGLKLKRCHRCGTKRFIEVLPKGDPADVASDTTRTQIANIYIPDYYMSLLAEVISKNFKVFERKL